MSKNIFCFQDIWNVRKAKLKASIDIIEKARAEDQDGISQNGGFLNISDYTQLGEFCSWFF